MTRRRVFTFGTFDRQCSGKRTYASKAEAKRIAKQANASWGGSAMHAYKCGRCGHFHVGHEPRFNPFREGSEVATVSTQEGSVQADDSLETV